MSDSWSERDYPASLRRLYEMRFTERELRRKRRVWSTLSRHWFQRWVEPTDTVLDLGAGSCEFVNTIAADRKIAVDLNPDTKRHAHDAEVHCVPSTDLSPIGTGSVDVVFTSNFFEHLPTKESLTETLDECARVLRPRGTLLVLMPNLRYLGGRYWDYYDHRLPLTHVSIVEALALSGFETERVIPRFLPYTVKDSRLPTTPLLIRAYLTVRPAWWLLGKQMFVHAVSPGS